MNDQYNKSQVYCTGVISILAKYAIVGHNLNVLENVQIYLDDKNHVVEIEERNREINNNVVLFPGLFNAHVHAADIELRGVASRNLQELVGRGGIKHRHLQELTNDQLQNSLQLSFEEGVKLGTLGWSDFREGGVDGITSYPLENSQYHLAFGRPSQNELDKLSMFPNIGIMDVKAYSEEFMGKLSEKINRKTQKLFIHASESLELRESWISKYGISDIIWSIDVLNPNAIIHATHADAEDIAMMSKSNTGAVICLRSNQFTNAGVPPVEALVASDLTLGIGTDNAMFSRLSLWDEFKSLTNYVESERLLSMATIEGALLCGVNWGISKGNTNFLEFHIPNHIQVADLKKWIINNGTEKNIVKIWR
ncbi:MAG: amidohydrolase family protein [Candidatus Heimdallarchaeota archaeon]|nr:amidohydrolase family protein [Candidatus Heimdallarchaeota archaeon]